MPIWTFTCEACGAHEEHLLAARDRDLPRACASCDKPLTRDGVTAFAPRQAGDGMGAILSNGQILKGHFHKDAPRKRPPKGRWGA